MTWPADFFDFSDGMRDKMQFIAQEKELLNTEAK